VREKTKSLGLMKVYIQFVLPMYYQSTIEEGNSSR